jgi:beta-lactamase regulating signal transducer with metallopeptidase domain
LALALRAPLRRAFGAGVAYAVWGVVPLAMLAVLLPGDVRPALPAALAMPQVWVSAPQGAETAGALPIAGSRVALWMVALWSLGAAAMAAALWRQQWRYRRSLGRLSPGADGVLYAQHALHGPLVLGAWRPRVVLPMDFAQRYPPAQAQLVLAHERMHIARGDTRHNLLLAALRCAYCSTPCCTGPRRGSASTRNWPAMRRCWHGIRLRAAATPRRCCRPSWMRSHCQSAAIGRPGRPCGNGSACCSGRR